MQRCIHASSRHFPPPPPAVAINLSFVSGAVIRGPIWILLVASSQLIVVLIHPVSLAGFHLLFDPFNNGHLSESVVALNRSWCNCWGFLWRFKPNKLSTDLYPFPRECGKYCRGIFPLLIGEKERNTCPFCCFGDGADKLVASPSLPSLHHLLFFFYSRLLFCRVFPLVFSFFHFFIRILPWEIAGSLQAAVVAVVAVVGSLNWMINIISSVTSMEESGYNEMKRWGEIFPQLLDIVVESDWTLRHQRLIIFAVSKWPIYSIFFSYFFYKSMVWKIIEIPLGGLDWWNVIVFRMKTICSETEGNGDSSGRACLNISHIWSWKRINAFVFSIISTRASCGNLWRIHPWSINL